MIQVLKIVSLPHKSPLSIRIILTKKIIILIQILPRIRWQQHRNNRRRTEYLVKRVRMPWQLSSCLQKSQQAFLQKKEP